LFSSKEPNLNRLTTKDRARILSALAEGMGINAACRMPGAGKNTGLRMLTDVGQACALYQDWAMRSLKLTNIQVEEYGY
jgi:hypothetical protein